MDTHQLCPGISECKYIRNLEVGKENHKSQLCSYVNSYTACFNHDCLRQCNTVEDRIKMLNKREKNTPDIFSNLGNTVVHERWIAPAI